MGLGPRLKAARKAAGLTQKQLADKVGLAAVTIRQYESELRSPPYHQLQRLADALNLSPYDFAAYPTIEPYEVVVPDPTQLPNPWEDGEHEDEDEYIEGNLPNGEVFSIPVDEVEKLLKKYTTEDKNKCLKVYRYDGSVASVHVSELKNFLETFASEDEDTYIEVILSDGTPWKVTVHDMKRYPYLFLADNDKSKGSHLETETTDSDTVTPQADGENGSDEHKPMATTSDPVESRLDVEVAYLTTRRRNKWLSVLTRSGKKYMYFHGELNAVLQELTPESIEMVTAFAQFLRQREIDYFRFSSSHPKG